jgi:hypothetical protein
VPLGAGPEIWPTNNFGECDLRPSKTQQKTSGRLTNEDITQDCLDIRSYIDTIRKHKADVITGIPAAPGNHRSPHQPDHHTQPTHPAGLDDLFQGVSQWS